MSRLFVAAWPPADVAAQLRTIARPDEPGIRWVPEANWHITLRFVGDTHVDEVASRLAAASLPRTVVDLGPRIERLDVRQIVLPAYGVDDLATSVQGATDDIGEVDHRRFRGHLTLARTRPRAASTVIGMPFATSWEITEIALVASELRSTGAVYSMVASFPTT